MIERRFLQPKDMWARVENDNLLYVPVVVIETTGHAHVYLSGQVAREPDATVVPYLIPGFTDAKYWSKLGTACYGFSPVRLERGDGDYAALFHGDDERVPVAGLHAGLRMLADAVARCCVRP